ncbi:type 1 glutamine amidotransferase [Streptomyces sp. NPDC031705]|uniref:type 1 glutamine amidotransferase n=1 Tax=Streptomyces sp. NPDC031705 TaxID=3155729 RepID=UPI0033D25A50
MNGSGRTKSGGPLRIVVLQHAGWEGPGTFGRLLDESGAAVIPVRVDKGEQPPALRSVDGILAMGGPMSVNDDVPWIAPEKEYIRRAVGAGVPFFGVCLGAQLLAASLGARVEPARAHYGLHPVDMAPGSFTDPLFGGLPRSVPVFQWHGENFGLPPGAVRLAGSPGCPNEAMRVGESAYGIQFHLEVDEALLGEWLAVPQCREELAERCGPDAPEAVTAGLAAGALRVQRCARRVWGGWMDLVAARGGV